MVKIRASCAADAGKLPPV